METLKELREEYSSLCEVGRKYPCAGKYRSDHKNVIFKQVKE